MIKLIGDIAPFLPGAIVSSQARRRLEKLAQLLPPFSGMMIECRLGSGLSEIDFSVRANAADGGREILAGWHPRLELSPLLLAAPEWQHIRNFCVQWRDRRLALHRHVENIWLEFDSETHCADAPIPCVFFDVAGRDFGDYEWITDSALITLFNRMTASPLKENLWLCLNSLPRTASLHYVGAMLSRSIAGVRLTVRLQGENHFDYFRFIASEARLDELRAMTTGLLPHGDSIVANLDVGHTISPNVGIEISPDDNEAWRLLLDALTWKGLCSKDESRALLAWPGQSFEFEAGAISPEVSLDTSNDLDDSTTRVHVRRLNHVKLVYRPNRRLEAKAYLYVGYGWKR